MCGICGIYKNDNLPIEVARLISMRSSLLHRGPDSVGIYNNRHCGLAACRLSIVDIEGSNQPIFNEDRSIVLVYNGMIYNYKELRDELVKKGHNFKTKGDGEVIVHLFEEKGADSFVCLHGMFAFALYDCKKNALILARDHFGIKPLYYYYDGHNFLFSSEIKAIKKTGLLKNEIDLESLNIYFSYNYIPGERTIYKNVFELLPGNFLKIDKNFSMNLHPFWKIKTISTDPKREFSLDEVKDDVSALLEESVQKHMRSDVEMGCFLSGGIDSSSLVHFISKFNNRRLKTFSISYNNKHYDESSFAYLVSRLYKTEHIELLCTEKDVVEFLETLSNISDVPLGDQAIVSTYLISRLARQYVKVCFSGEGADELFIGYETYTANYFYNMFKYCPNLFLNCMEKIIDLFPASDKKVSFDYKALHFIQGLKLKNLNQAHPYWRIIFPKLEKAYLLKPHIYEHMDTLNFHKVYFERIDGDNKSPEYYSNADLTGFLTFNNLIRTDMYSMRNSLEVRVPFLYKPLVEYVINLPFSIRFRKARTKYLFKEIMKGKLDPRIIRRKKGGWHMPISSWLKNGLFDYCYDIFNSKHILFDEMLERKHCINLLIRHKKRKENNAYKIWGILVLLKTLDP